MSHDFMNSSMLTILGESAANTAGAAMQGAVYRVRPLMMTVVAIMAGLLPIMWGSGSGSEVMRRIAAPMVGGMVSATILTLIVIPAIYALVKEFTIRPRTAKATLAGPSLVSGD